MGYLAAILFFAAIGFVFFFTRKSSAPAAASDQSAEPELTERFRLGRYVRGFSAQKEPVAIVSCGVTDKDFVVCKGVIGAEIGRIARCGITDISLTRQGEAEFLLALSWNDAAGAPQKAVFSFDDKKLAGSMAAEARDALQKWQGIVHGQPSATGAATMN
ncbi:MAG: hypothetical protein FJ119_03395 [Deltaproteobacteria bacterium]|nr:hypothetical protein [Deltaproteobacteria bacterium]